MTSFKAFLCWRGHNENEKTTNVSYKTISIDELTIAHITFLLLNAFFQNNN